MGHCKIVSHKIRVISTSNIYNEFIKHEKNYSDTYLKSLQIYDERFEEKYYDFLKPFLNKIDLTNKIYEIIDDLIKDLGFDYNIRFLILGDFLFSMTSSDLTDPSNLIFKTNRNDYMNRIRLRALINTSFNCDIEKYILLHKKLLIGLRLLNIIKKTQIRTINNNNWETVIYFELILEEISLKYAISIGFSKSPFILVNINKTKYSLASFRNIWKTKRKKREMEEFWVCYESVVKANQIKLSLSSKILEINNECITNEKNKLLKENECVDIEEYFEKVIKILKDDKYVNTLLMGVKKIEDVKYKDIFILKINIKSEYIKLMSNFQKIISIFLLNQKIIDQELYLPCFIDNRGRQYYGTLISPTFYKLFRYLYIFSIKKFFLNLDNSTFYNKIIEYKNIVKEFNLDIKKSYILIVLFIEVGKFFIKAKDGCFVKTEDIINHGIDNHKNKNINLKFEDLLYVQKIYYLIDNLINKNIIDENTIIFKDATASGLQNYGILLNYKKDMLKYLNINGEDWCDTYQYIIEKFLKDKIENKWISKEISTDLLLKRKHWKSTIMTIPYNAVWFTCFMKFINSLKEDDIDYKKLTLEEKKQLKSIHKEFYNEIKENIKKEFYKGEIQNILIFKYNKWMIVNKQEYKINYKKARDKYSNTLYMISEDEKGTQRALEANNMHYRDSELVKEIMKTFEIIPIHDCFGIRLCELHLVIDEINQYYSKKIGEKTYCIHIIK